MEKEKELIAGYEFENNDSDQIWVDKYLFYKNPDGSFQKEFKSGWSPKFDSTESITQEEVLSEMEKATNSVGKYKRGGYRITKAIQSIEDSKKWDRASDAFADIFFEDTDRGFLMLGETLAGFEADPGTGYLSDENEKAEKDMISVFFNCIY